MTPKIDPYSTKLHTRINVLLLVFTVVIFAIVLRTSAHGQSATRTAYRGALTLSDGAASQPDSALKDLTRFAPGQAPEKVEPKPVTNANPTPVNAFRAQPNTFCVPLKAFSAPLNTFCPRPKGSSLQAKALSSPTNTISSPASNPGFPANALKPWRKPPPHSESNLTAELRTGLTG